MDILRASDNQNNPIFEAEDQGYEKGDPEDPNDDNYIYLIRRYRLEDFVFMGESKDASEGEVWLYNPDLEKVGTWEISSLQCLNHDNECDGLHAVYEEGHDTRHALLVPVPVSMMDEGGTYIFVLHIKDDHPELYRDHQHRWTLELNSIKMKAMIEDLTVPLGLDPFDTRTAHIAWCRKEFMSKIWKRTIDLAGGTANPGRTWVFSWPVYEDQELAEWFGTRPKHIRAGLNGQMFEARFRGMLWQRGKIIGDIGVGTPGQWLSGSPRRQVRWCFGMNARGTDYKVRKMQPPRGRQGFARVPKEILAYPYGMSQVGCVVHNSRPVATDEIGWVFNEVDHRSVLAWSSQGDLLLIGTTPLSIEDLQGFLTDSPNFQGQSLRDYMRKRPWLREMEIADAILLDGGSSTDRAYMWRDSRGDPRRMSWSPCSVFSRLIPSMIGAGVETKD